MLTFRRVSHSPSIHSSIGAMAVHSASTALLLSVFLGLLGSACCRIAPRMFCPPDFTRIHDRCYYFSTATMNWDQALEHCQQLDPRAMLANLETTREWLSIHTYLKEENLSSKFWWIGATDRDEEGKWTWYGSNQPVEFGGAWCPGQPDNAYTNENCALLWKPDLCWNDASCTHSNLNFICEYE